MTDYDVPFAPTLAIRVGSDGCCKCATAIAVQDERRGLAGADGGVSQAGSSSPALAYPARDPSLGSEPSDPGAPDDVHDNAQAQNEVMPEDVLEASDP